MSSLTSITSMFARCTVSLQSAVSSRPCAVTTVAAASRRKPYTTYNKCQHQCRNMYSRYQHIHHRSTLTLPRSPPSTHNHRHFSSIQLNQLPSHTPHRLPQRVGRGPGSGMGKTSKRGHKGQGARSHVKTIFEGGQTPMWRRTPKRGFKPFRAHERVLTELNVQTLMRWVHCNRVDAQQQVTLRTLQANGLRIHKGVKLLARGSSTIDRPIHVVVTDCSLAAKQAIERAGGSVTLKYHTDVALRALLKPEKYTDAVRPSTECTPPPQLRFKYERQLCAGEPLPHDAPVSMREAMIRSGSTAKSKK